jgi:hypothetical protein
MDAVKLMHAIRERNPAQRVGIITGWPVLQKPFRQQALLEFLKQFA